MPRKREMKLDHECAQTTPRRKVKLFGGPGDGCSVTPPKCHPCPISNRLIMAQTWLDVWHIYRLRETDDYVADYVGPRAEDLLR